MNPALLVAETAAVGAVAVGAMAMAASAARPRPRQVIVAPARPYAPAQIVVQQPLPRQGVVVVGDSQPQAVQQPPLAIAAAALPPTLIENRGDTTFYAVDVTPEAGQASWRVYRRFNDFFEVNQRLTALSPGLTFPGAPFPSKTLFKCTGAAVEVRRSALELWLRRVLEHPHSRGIWAGTLRQFFEAGRQMLMPAPPALAPAQQAPQAPLAQSSAPLAEIGAPLQQWGSPQPVATEASSGQLLQIEIPAGITAGQTLAVAVPDGRELHFQVPEGATPGSQVELWFDPAAGTLRPVS